MLGNMPSGSHHVDVTLPGPIQRPRERRYGAEVQDALRISWQAANYIGSKRLAPFLEELVPALEKHGYLGLSEEVRNQLLSISPATIDRILRPLRKGDVPKGSVRPSLASFSRSRFLCVRLLLGMNQGQDFSRAIWWPIVGAPRKEPISKLLC